MVQQILDDLRTYFEAKTTITPEEQALLQRLKMISFLLPPSAGRICRPTASIRVPLQMLRCVDWLKKWQMITASSFFGQAWKLSPKGWSFRVTPNVRFAPAGMFVSMGRKVLFVVKVAGRSGMNICMFWLSFLTTRLSSKKIYRLSFVW